ncbi:hypothetical protein A8709_15095 [Paenibacillus pectinilyticus]|uniref:Beta-hexosaminidase bacterial type N-terminal domain-containing protein n=2 Tax=Paenibacillus pectinilyticus TaxID=512399 RepID=A0A1C1A599_9BACL|nr:hypothetical protein A8709_15095 [Paenibacillus pectinilyticus]
MQMLTRDFATVLGVEPELVHASSEADIIIRYAVESDGCASHPEAFAIRYTQEGEHAQLHIVAHDDLGLVYGILHVSETVLGIQPFWFWADQSIAKRDAVVVECKSYDSPVPKVRFRGWFVNDEVCLIGWKEAYPPTREVWLPVFEALLRCGGNMVIPGTDLPKTGIHFDLAAEMGLWITHHHAEPLGAEMFLRAYTGRSASYNEAPELFEKLWRKAIEKQKDQKILWVLSFRGQGDKPFWENDPSYDTPEKRGEMISRVIYRQYDMIGEAVQNPVYCVALYGEIAELYKGGYIDLPPDVIKIWADNGYGKMVSRRHGNINMRMPALPSGEDQGRNGIYYHVTFHDLQASNHLTPFQASASFVKDEIERSFEAGCTDYLLLNCGNIRQHVYMLDMIRELWNTGTIETGAHLEAFVSCYYGEANPDIMALYRTYAEAAISYGPNSDDLAGDEFYHHPTRRLIGHWLQGRTAEADRGLLWATGEGTFAEQVQWFEQRSEEGHRSWSQWLATCEALLATLEGDEKHRVSDHLQLPGILHQSGAEGMLWVCRAYAAAAREEYAQAFVYASQSMWCYKKGLQAMREAEHDKWTNFYRADWLTNIASTVNNVDTLRRFLRMQGDSPDFFHWYKEYLMPETEKYIYLENTHRNPLSDDELASRLQTYFENN